MKPIKTDVLIVGAGPIGLCAALLLEKIGLDYLVVERRSSLHMSPQAHVISSRTLEICRSVGVSDVPIRAAGPILTDTMNIRWVDRLIGRDLGSFSLGRDPQSMQDMLSNTPTPTTNLSQDQFEQVLYDHLPQEKVRFGASWQGFETVEQAYVSTLTGLDNVQLTVESRYIIGADGAGSVVRKSIGANMVGPDNIQTYVTIHFSANLREQLKGREALLYWVMEKECEGVFIAHDIDSNWIFMKTASADEQIDTEDKDKFENLLRKAIGEDVELTINSIDVWRMSAQISDAYQSGNMFLVGDAAHRFPPTGGIGMNTGIQDAHNLVWKLAMVENGVKPALLETYEVERKPVAETNSTQSLSNAMKMSEVAQSLDADGDKQISMSDINAVLTNPNLSARTQTAIDHQSAHFNMSGLDLGFCYRSNALVEDGIPPQSDNPVSKYLPSTTPGGRMPHIWLTVGETQQSTLDLINYGRFLVLATDSVENLEAVTNELRDKGYPVDLESIGTDTNLQPADDSFVDLFNGEVLLIRPDGHIAARLTGANAAYELGHIIEDLFPLDDS